MRPRAAPDAYQPVWDVNEHNKVSSMEDEIEQTRVGEAFQAVLPAVRPRTATLSADEQALLEPPIWTGTLQSPRPVLCWSAGSTCLAKCMQHLWVVTLYGCNKVCQLVVCCLDMHYVRPFRIVH